MNALRELVAKIVLDTGNARKKLDDVEKGFDDVKDASGRARDAMGRFIAGSKQAQGGMADLGSSLRTLVAGFLGFQAASGVARFVGGANAEFERLNSALITATGSEAAAEKAFASIEKFAATTPYELAGVTDAFIKLQNLGLDPSEKALTAYGNTASAMGKPLMQMIEAVADASTGEFERLKEFGIRSKRQGDQVSFTFRGVTRTVGMNSAEIESYLQEIGTVQFAGGMARQSRDLTGIWSNLMDNAARLSRAIGKGGLWDALKRATSAMVDATGKGDSMAEAIGRRLGAAVDWVRENIGWMSRVVAVAGAAFAAWKIGAIAQGLYAVAKSATVAGIAAKLFGGSMRSALISTGIGALIVGIGLLAEDIYQFATGGESMIGGLAEKFPAFGAAVDGLVAFFRLAAPIVSDFWYGFIEGVQVAQAYYGPFFTWLVSYLSEALGGTFRDLGIVIGAFFEGAATTVLNFVEFFATIWQQPSSILSAFWALVQQQFAAGLAFLQTIMPNVTAAIAGAFQAAYNAAAQWINSIIAKIQGIGPAFLQAVAKIPGGSMALSLAGVTPAADAAKPPGGGGGTVNNYYGGNTYQGGNVNWNGMGPPPPGHVRGVTAPPRISAPAH